MGNPHSAAMLFKVVHRHRVAGRTFRRVSELVFVGGKPRAVLDWIENAGVTVPLYACDLDPDKLRKPPRGSRTYYYDEVTVDPRYEDTDEDGPRAR